MIVTPTPRPVFDSYALPLPRRRQGLAAALSFIAHVTIAILVLWRGTALFEGGSGSGTGPRGGGGGGRPAVALFALPAASVPQVHDIPPAPAVAVLTVAVPVPQPVKIDVPPPNVIVPLPPQPAAIGTGAGTTGGPGQGPGTGGGTGTGTGTGVGADSGSGSGGRGSDIIPAEPKWTIIPPQGMPRGSHQVRFWVTAEGVVTRVEVTPPIKDAEYRREFMKRMMGYLFRPARARDGRAVDFVATVIFSQH